MRRGRRSTPRRARPRRNRPGAQFEPLARETGMTRAGLSRALAYDATPAPRRSQRSPERGTKSSVRRRSPSRARLPSPSHHRQPNAALEGTKSRKVAELSATFRGRSATLDSGLNLRSAGNDKPGACGCISVAGRSSRPHEQAVPHYRSPSARHRPQAPPQPQGRMGAPARVASMC